MNSLQALLSGKKASGIIPLLFFLLLHAAIQWSHLQLDFWNDELYTLEHFVFQSFGAPSGDYHSTNNHILFSLLAQVWAMFTGTQSLPAAVVNPFVLRLLPFLCSCGAVALVYRLGGRMGGRWAAAFSALLLITTIPFYNYAAQMRGYSLSMLLFAASGNAAFSALSRPTLYRIGGIVLCGILLLYTLPSNIYFIAALMMVVACSATFQQERPAFRAAVITISALLAACIIAIFLYLPLRTQMSRLPIFASGTARMPLEALRERLPVVAYHLLSGRYLLLLPLAAFIALHRSGRWLCIMAVLFLLPFVLADARGNSTPYRVFLTGLPLLCVGIGVAMERAVTTLKSIYWQWTAASMLMVYCLATCFFQVKKTEVAALHDIERGTRSGDLYFQYYLHYFHPRADAALYMQRFARPGIPLVEACRMDEEVLKYLTMAGWDRRAAKKLSLERALISFDTVDVLTEQAPQLRETLRSMNYDRGQSQLLPGERSVQIIRLVKPVL